MAPLTDLHCHWLPGLDDGPRDLDATVELLRAAWSGGTRRLAATPHMFAPGFPDHDQRRVRECFERTIAHLRRRSGRPGEAFLAELSLSLGAENHLSAEFLEALERRRVLPLAGGRFLLLELSPYLAADAAAVGVERLRAAGYRPVLAHAERYQGWIDDPGRVAALREAGVLLQVNGDSLLGAWGPAVRRSAWRLLASGQAQIVASDGHDLRHRPPALDGVRSLLAAEFADQAVEAWMGDNPAAVLDDREPVPAGPPRGRADRRWPSRRRSSGKRAHPRPGVR